MRVFIVAAVAISTFVVATPASATCQTEPDVGDICTVVDRFCTENKLGQHVCRD